MLAHVAFGCGLHGGGHSRNFTVKNSTRFPLVLGGLLGLLLFCSSLPAAEPMPPNASLNQPRTGHTEKFGSRTITNRSDGPSSQTEKFGSGDLQRDQPGKKSRP